MAVGDIYRIAIFSWQPPQLAVNVHHRRVSSESAPDPDLNEFANWVHQRAGLFYPGWLVDTASLVGAEVQRIHPGAESYVGRSDGTAIPGEQDSQALPYQTAGLISLRTALAGRKNRGRQYLPFFPESLNDDDGRPSSTAQTLMANWMASLIAAWNFSPGVGPTMILQPVIWSRGDEAYAPVISGRVRRDWATVRRRSRIGHSDDPFS